MGLKSKNAPLFTYNISQIFPRVNPFKKETLIIGETLAKQKGGRSRPRCDDKSCLWQGMASPVPRAFPEKPDIAYSVSSRVKM
jgi:hypothetical protein